MVALVYHALISTLAHKVSTSQALLSAPQDVRPLNCLQLQTAPALSPGFRQEPEPGPLQEVMENAIQPHCVFLGAPCALGTLPSLPKRSPAHCTPAPVEHLPSLSLLRMKLL